MWLDQLDIHPGERWDRAVEEALRNSERILLILSPSSVSSDNVLDEVSFALETNKTIIPVLYLDCAIPFRLRRLQYIDFRTDYDRGLKELLRTLVEQQSLGAAVPKPVVDSERRDERDKAASAGSGTRAREVRGEEYDGGSGGQRIADRGGVKAFFKSRRGIKIAAGVCGGAIVALVLYWLIPRPTGTAGISSQNVTPTTQKGQAQQAAAPSNPVLRSPETSGGQKDVAKNGRGAESAGAKAEPSKRPAPASRPATGTEKSGTPSVEVPPKQQAAVAQAPVTPPKFTTCIDAQLCGLLGKPVQEAYSYLGQPDNYNAIGDGVMVYSARGLELELYRAPDGQTKVVWVHFYMAGPQQISGVSSTFTRNAGDVVPGLAPGMTRAAIEAGFGKPAGVYHPLSVITDLEYDNLMTCCIVDVEFYSYGQSHPSGPANRIAVRHRSQR